jgi:tetratricopeptide (TPR) repeat protein
MKSDKNLSLCGLMAENDNEKKDPSRYKPEGYAEAFPTDMGEVSMQVASLIDLGKDAYKKESFDQAIKYFNRALDMDPINKEAKFLKRKTMLTLSRLLEGKTKVEDDEEVEHVLADAISSDLDTAVEDRGKVELREERKVAAGPSQRPMGPKRDRPSMYKPPQKDFRKAGGRVYSIPDTDKKFNKNAKKMSYRSGDSFLERRETRILIFILVLFMVGILFVSVYFGWIPV